jgi:crotonobetainyl-CoA:carnitine CoA-transferase CaiB-like acyl-CoA transferase
VAAGSLVGQHTDRILEELGYSTEAVDALKTAQVVFAPDTSGDTGSSGG